MENPICTSAACWSVFNAGGWQMGKRSKSKRGSVGQGGSGGRMEFSISKMVLFARRWRRDRSIKRKRAEKELL